MPIPYSVADATAGVDPAAFDDFYRHFYVRVLVLMRRHFPGCDAEDVAQETMARCYARFATLDAARDPWPWVASVARNTAIDTMRRGRRVESIEDVPVPKATAYDVTYDTMLAGERRRSLARALRRLKPADRQLIEDHDLEGIACAEIAAVRDLTPNALRQQLHRARRRLAVELSRTGGAFGLVGGVLHARLARVSRRLNDVSIAGGASTSAFSLVAAATLATTVATGVIAPATSPAARTAPAKQPQVRPVAAAPLGDVVPSRPLPAPTAGPESAAPAPMRTIDPKVGPTSIPVAVYQSGDPMKNEPNYTSVDLQTPLGPWHVVSLYNDATPGLDILCDYHVLTCPS